MSLSAGSRLGPFEIAALLGAGGMGEVYRARDTRLDRTVAIKILPEALAGDPQFRERFDREARAISSLNHPHICTLHDIGRQDGIDFLVMEYLEGETLADRIRRPDSLRQGYGGPPKLHAEAEGLRLPGEGRLVGEGRLAGEGSGRPSGLPIEEALQIAIQIADALATAHRAGVIHRDLKPGNIFLVGKHGSSGDLRRGGLSGGDVRRGGPSGPPMAKLLDFGLAKATAPAVAGASLSMAETTPPSLTSQGTILGTFQYMAPEQIEGRDAPDGRRLVRQGSHRLPQFLPDGRRFLFFAQGNPEGQGIYLGSLDGTDTTRLTPAEAAGAYVEPGAVVFMQQNTLVVRGLDVAGGMLTGDPVTVADRVSYDAGFNLGGFSVSATGRLAYRAGGSERRQLTWFDRTGKVAGVAGDPDTNNPFTPALSPDGRRIAVTRTVQSNQDMWVIDVLRGGATRFTFDPAADQLGVWSPDGTRLAFASNRKGIYDLFLKPSSGAGAEELVLASPVAKMPTDWSLDGRFLLYQHGDPKTGWDLAALPMMGDRKPVVVVSTPFEERGGQFSPDGRWVAYQSNESGRFEIYVQPFPGPGGKWQASTAGGTDPRWRSDGKELFFLAPDARLMAVPVRASDSTFDAGSAATLFRTRTFTGGSASLTAQYAVLRDGRFLINVSDETSTAAPITVILNWTPGLEP